VDWQCIQEKTFYSAGISIKGIKGRISWKSRESLVFLACILFLIKIVQVNYESPS
jgi:hypothetical protein